MESAEGARPGSEESGRSPRWFRPGKAMAKLAENREPRYANEHCRVVGMAVKKLRDESHGRRSKASPRDRPGP
jgi:hypothetical protein